ncbi:hypothetical protein Strvi_1754 [Streptomyces violaceusniger Tu 4113]|uniref:Uncharacterized protein n=1 Tax=Streptomyces violaceusniger (strain Tu 4113) TaxID=653045 RepID=G2NT72_STRV4|nr:hypothetical protein Strvi_1754 [Streptomyces violaceusniger Tu 4113]
MGTKAHTVTAAAATEPEVSGPGPSSTNERGTAWQ